MIRLRRQARTSTFALSVAKRSRSACGEIANPAIQKGVVQICVVLCACAAFLAGCVHATQSNFLQHYTLSAAAPSLNGEREAANAHGRILQITGIDVPDWLDGTAMYYRLDYRADGRLASYANSDWIAPPATLLQPLLQKAILAGGGWRAVIGPRNPASADVELRIGLDDFSQSFSQPNASTGVLDATATLIATRDEHVIAQRHFRVEIAAPTADAPGGAKALGIASARFADELQRWLDSADVGANAAEDRQGNP
jgi:cholesterol transport system auxiliary component